MIRYVPGETIVETKSLKFYLASFRNQPAFNEEIVNRILDDLVSALKPQELIVRGEFAPRGGIQLTTEATYPDAAVMKVCVLLSGGMDSVTVLYEALAHA